MATNFANILDPSLTIDEQQLARRQQLADMLRQQALTQDQPQMAGGMVVPYHPLQGLAKLAQAYMANRSDEKNDALRQELAKRQSQALINALGAQQGPSMTSVPIDNSDYMQEPKPGMVPLQQAPNPFSMRNLLRGGAIAQLGGAPAAASFWEQHKPTEATRTALAAGLDPAAANRAALAKMNMYQYQPGTMTQNLMTGQTFSLPSLEKGQIISPTGEVQTAPGYIPSMTGITGAQTAAQEANKIINVTTPSGAVVPMFAGQAVQGGMGQTTSGKQLAEKATGNIVQKLDTSFGDAQLAANSLPTIQRAINLVNSGVYSGQIGDWKAAASRIFGADAEKLANTTELKSYTVNQMLGLLSQLKGATSDKEMREMQNAVANPASLSDAELTRLLNVTKKKLEDAISSHSGLLKRVNPDFLRNYGMDLSVEMPKYEELQNIVQPSMGAGAPSGGWGIQRVR